MLAKQPHIVVFCTGWGPTNGGINSFNADLCRGLAAVGCSVTCVVLHVDAAEVARAERQGIKVLSLGVHDETFSEDAKRKISTIRSELEPCDLWIGHDTFTGSIAREARDGSTCQTVPVAILHHMHYLSYKALEGNAPEADTKNSAQRDTLSLADVVFAVGPKLASSARDILRHLEQKAPAVHEITPGLRLQSALPAPQQFQLFFAGRLNGKTARLKQPNLAVAAFGKAVDAYGDALGTDPILTLVGTAADAEASAMFEDLAAKHARRRVTVHALPFTEAQTALLERLRGQSAAMLLSIHEGFGLTAWESIGVGIPLIVSKNSGVYEFLHRTHGGSATGCLSVVDIKASARPEEPSETDIATVAEAIGRIARDPAGARKDAYRLQQQLQEYTWERVAKSILTGSGLPAEAVYPQKDARGPGEAQPSSNHEPGAPAAECSPPKSDPDSYERQSIRLVNAGRGPLFDIYDPSCKPYYVARDIDNDIAPLIPAAHVWLWGDIGVGKTTTLRHALMSLPSYLYISLSSCIGLPVDSIFEQILLELTERLDGPAAPAAGLSTGAAVRQIVRLLQGRTERGDPEPFLIHLDEIPLDNDVQEREFCRGMISLLISHSTSSDTSRFALTTLTAPVADIGRAQAKVRERLFTRPIPEWSDSDLERLLTVTDHALNAPLQLTQRQAIVRHAHGSPRFVKMCVRKLLAFENNSAWTFERILSETGDELRQ